MDDQPAPTPDPLPPAPAKPNEPRKGRLGPTRVVGGVLVLLACLAAAWFFFLRAPLVRAEDLIEHPEKYHESVVQMDMKYRGSHWGKYPVLCAEASSGNEFGFSFHMPDDIAKEVRESLGKPYRVKVKFFDKKLLQEEFRKNPSYSFQRPGDKLIRQGDILSISAR
jgi:hypothetical protein